MFKRFIFNFTGDLCGACKDGFSISIMSGKCTSNNTCNRAQWFWAFAVMAALAYASWYTFKDDILAIPSNLLMKIVDFIKQRIAREKTTKHKDYAVENNVNAIASNEPGPDRGYFGIVTFYVQARNNFI